MRDRKTVYAHRTGFGKTNDTQNKEAASRRLLLTSFKGIRKSIGRIQAPSHQPGAPAHRSDEFPAGYSLTGCSPAWPASASPAGVSMLEHQPNTGLSLNHETVKLS